ncbi:3-hydroxyacyl-ACP dehydratase FabZ [Buchnera aphidicola]|nr:3-hydroxyacyl-ACP dehydratase FabZ [Buchnera aphidicola]
MKNILKFIPQRYPFLLIDRIQCCNNKNTIKVIKNITLNDPLLQGHSPDKFIFPGVLILESILQSSIILASINHPENKNSNGFYCVNKIYSVKFKKFVLPGDQLIIKVKLLKEYKKFIFFKGTVFVENNFICCANIICKYVLYF